MFQDDPYHAYLDNNIASENPVSLVTALYQGAIQAVQQARHCLETEDIWGRSKAISKAVDIITELTLSLNHEKGGDLSKRLKDLYGYMQTRLLTAHADQQEEPMAEVIGLLTTLLDGWYKAEEQLAREAREDAPSEKSAREDRAEPAETPYGYGCAPAGEESTVFTV